MDPCAETATARDPLAVESYRKLGVLPEVSDADLRRAYRRLALLHHPDHNGGSPVAGGRFAEIQSAYDTVLTLRRRCAEKAIAAAHDVQIPLASTRGSADAWLRSRIAAVERDYAAQRASTVDDGDPRPSPYAPRPRRDSLRAQLTDWFRDA